MWKRKMKIKWIKKKLKRNCGLEEEEKVNDVTEKNGNKRNKKKLKRNCGLEEEEKVNDVTEKNENKMK